MEERESLNNPFGILFESGEEVSASAMESLDLCFKLLQGCLEVVQKMPSPNFNIEQCGYLVDKLEVVVQVARSFEVSHANHCGLESSWNVTKWIGIFKLLLALAKQIEDFIVGCSRAAWVEAAMTLTNVAEYVSSLGFNLELCKVLLLEGECVAMQHGLSWVEVDTLNRVEVEMVKLKAIVDKEYLLKKVTLALDTSDLAKYLLRRLVRIHPNPTCDEDNILGKLFAWVVLGRHEEQLGRGASATVYKVMWLGTPVAKKTFFGPENPFFLKEVEILSQLCHPNITSMFCSMMNKRSCSIIMELMDCDLFTLIQRRCGEHSDSPPFSIFEALDLMLQIAEGVNYLHSKGIIHRDLKSSNILVKMMRVAELETGYVQAKVVDFGLSKTKEQSATYSQMTYNEGTCRWMAPELVKPSVDNPKCIAKSEGVLNYKFKCDVYSFAMVCYEILTGDLPFKDEWMPRKIKQLVLEGERPKLPTNCHAMLKALIEKCWIGKPKERPSFSTICSTLQYMKYIFMRDLNVLPKEVENWPYLTNLDSIKCSTLKALPKEVDNLYSWIALHLDGYSRLESLAKEAQKLSSMVILDLRWSSTLEALPKEIRILSSLITLDLRECSSLKALPKEVGDLSSLTIFNLGGCSSLLALPKEVGKLSFLTTLDLRWCSSLKVLPKEIGNLSSLATLIFDGCSRLEAVPSEIGNLSSLTTLNLDGCSRLEALPKEVGNLSSLITIDLRKCSSLKALPKEVGSLSFLATIDLRECSSLTTLPNEVENLSSLTTLDLRECSSLKALPKEVGSLFSLSTLDLENCSSLEALPKEVGSLFSLNTLVLQNCSSLKALPKEVGNLSSLHIFNLNNCSKLEALPNEVGNLSSLTFLDLTNCEKLQTLPKVLGNLSSLNILNLRGCFKLEALPKEIGNLSSLTILDLSWCSSLEALPKEVGNLASLTTLYLIGCSKLVALPREVGNLSSLTTLYLISCSCLKALPNEVENLSSLTTLDLRKCSSLEALPKEIGNLSSLTTLNLEECSSLEAMPKEVEKLSSLTTLNLWKCSNLKILPKEVEILSFLTTRSFRGFKGIKLENISE